MAHSRIAGWQALTEELRALADDLGAPQAVVMDASNSLWCDAYPMDDTGAAFDALEVALASADKPLTRGGRVDLTTATLRARSFASIYVLIVMFADEPRDALRVDAAIVRRLPQIEALTVALPPQGPGRKAIAARLRVVR